MAKSGLTVELEMRSPSINGMKAATVKRWRGSEGKGKERVKDSRAKPKLVMCSPSTIEQRDSEGGQSKRTVESRVVSGKAAESKLSFFVFF